VFMTKQLSPVPKSESLSVLDLKND
jgi:hypothetical protein